MPLIDSFAAPNKKAETEQAIRVRWETMAAWANGCASSAETASGSIELARCRAGAFGALRDKLTGEKTALAALERYRLTFGPKLTSADAPEGGGWGPLAWTEAGAQGREGAATRERLTGVEFTEALGDLDVAERAAAKKGYPAPASLRELAAAAAAAPKGAAHSPAAILMERAFGSAEGSVYGLSTGAKAFVWTLGLAALAAGAAALVSAVRR